MPNSSSSNTGSNRLSHIERKGKLVECAVDIRQRQRGEAAQPARMRLHEFRRELVAAAGQRPRAGVVAHVHPRRRDRGHRHVDARLVHVGQHHVGVAG